MRICPKCSKTFDDGSKICRDCGAILNPVEVPQPEETPTNSTESVFADDQGEEELLDSQWEQTPWRCPTCKESIEPSFDACWNCGTNRSGKPDPGFVSERTDPEGAEPEPRVKIPQGEACPRCGSTRVIPDAYLGEPHHMEWNVTANVAGNPKAWIFKDVEHSELKADICGECGHVELKVTNPEVLYKHYLNSINPL